MISRKTFTQKYRNLTNRHKLPMKQEKWILIQYFEIQKMDKKREGQRELNDLPELL
jgi:hypothetical protein